MFTNLVSRAIQIEITHVLDMDSFIQALARFDIPDLSNQPMDPIL